ELTLRYMPVDAGELARHSPGPRRTEEPQTVALDRSTHTDGLVKDLDCLAPRPQPTRAQRIGQVGALHPRAAVIPTQNRPEAVAPFLRHDVHHRTIGVHLG